MPSEGTIRNGAAAGLRFDTKGGNWRYLMGPIEPYEEDALLKFLKPGGVFYDIGANIGYYALVAARKVGETGKVYAFEPMPNTAETVRKNARSNGFNNVEVLEKAAGDKAGMLTLTLADMSEMHSLKWGPEGSAAIATTGETQVEIVVMDEFVRKPGVRPPDVIMIDVEGAEVDVINGLRETLRQHRPAVLCEVHWIRDEFYALRDGMFKEIGYTITTLDGKPIPEEPVRYHALILPEGGG